MSVRKRPPELVCVCCAFVSCGVTFVSLYGGTNVDASARDLV